MQARNPQTDSAEYSKITLDTILNAWCHQWLEEKGAYLEWFVYKHSDVRKKLTGIFRNSTLWDQGAQGLVYLDETQRRIPIEGDEQWDSQVQLRGTIVIKCKQKIFCQHVEETHHKHGIHISEIYKDLVRYAQTQVNFASMLKHLELQKQNDADELCDPPSVYFHPVIELEKTQKPPQKPPKPSTLITENEGSDNDSDSDSDAPPPSEEELNVNQNENENIADSLTLKLKLYVSVLSAYLQQNTARENNKYANELFVLVEKMENSKPSEGFNGTDEILYVISLVFCAFDCGVNDNACDAIVDDYLIDLITQSENAYYFYCLSIIALKVERFDLAKQYIDNGVKILSKNPEDEQVLEIRKYKNFIEIQNFQTAAVLYPAPRVQSQRVSIKLLRESQKISVSK